MPRQTYATGRAAPASLSAAAFLMFVATLFYWLVAFSVPFIKHIHFVHTRENDVKYGTFGWCALANRVCYRHVGYAWHPEIIDNTHLTGSLILIALTAAFGTFAFFSLLHSLTDLRSGVCSFFLTLFTSFLAFLSFLLALICFGVAHHRFNRASLDAHYGAALPLLILGWLMYMACIPLVFIGWLREHHYRRRNLEASTVPATPTTRRRWF
ncbi:hypothetical protein M231_05164 [Tremella mesenterica]|uniref:Pali-domain-containing protein n=1 Tax=Tremella mesenterica TaxID=5217 RepID=A0A4Q1BIN2_TREME|nr:uncharacterized protein TREMEDRAFT_58780 [Tremella mesenterica DSM 1558]EIW72609.1 hypothetical protein TREMEDRAFT_58780 [Tremella mesenterica DSM 1558]RXK37539.1 hypothetical protein M231_05164 [Tremella mesenterica]